jgi:hypothetical protein
MSGHIRQQGNVARPLYSHGQNALVPGTGTGPAARLNLSSIRNKGLELRRIFIIDYGNLVPAKGADLPLGYISSSAPPSRFSVSGLCHFFYSPILVSYF